MRQLNQRGFTLVELLVVLAILGIVMVTVLNVYMTGNTIGQTGQNRAEAQQGARAGMLMEEDLRLAGYGCPASGCAPPVPLPAGCAAPPAQSNFICATQTSVSFWADLINASTVLSAQANAGNIVLTVVSGSGFTAGDTAYLINYNAFNARTVASATNTTVTVNAPGPPSAYPQGSQVGRPKVITYSWAGGTLFKDAGDGRGLQPLATGVQAFQLRYYDLNENLLPTPISAANIPNIRRVRITMTAQSAAAQNRGTFTLDSSVRPRNL